MQILELRKRNIKCAKCGDDLPRLDLVNKVNWKYYCLGCAKANR